MSNFKNKFELIEIIDAHSQLKSKMAIELVEKVINKKYNIEYRQRNDSDAFKCMNNIVKKVSNKSNSDSQKKEIFETRLRGRDEICKKHIKDVFIIKNTKTGKVLSVGNSCISSFVLNDFLINVNSKDFKCIIKLMSIKRLCLFCNKKCSLNGFHKNCIKGHGTNYKYPSMKKNIVLYNSCVSKLKFKFAINQVGELFSGVTFINKCVNSTSVNKKTVTALYEFIDGHEFFICNRGKLLSYQNNRVINTVKIQRRKPSIRQKLLLEKLINEYNRLIIIDRENTNPNYMKYGYVYKQ